MTLDYIHKMMCGFSGNSNHCRDVALQRLPAPSALQRLAASGNNIWQQRLAATLVLQRPYYICFLWS